MAKHKRNTSRIPVFKGIEARLNKAIFHILAIKGPLTIYGIHKILKTRRRLRHVCYASVNKRVRSLEELGYVRRMGVKRTKAGFEASIYGLATKAYLALLFDYVNLEDLLKRIDNATATAILAALIYIT